MHKVHKGGLQLTKGSVPRSITMRNKAHEKEVTKGLSKAKYKYQEPCKRDLLNVLRVYKGLAPQLDTFVFDNGDERKLLNVHGTIPVVYKNVTYNIPVCFWLLLDYPSMAPMGFVQPTVDMQIKVSSSVDHNGRICLPYLAEWKYPEANLLDLIQICVLVFGQAPPVFTKARASVTTRQSSTSSSSSILQREAEQRQKREAAEAEAAAAHDVLSQKELRASLVSAAEDLLRVKLEEEFMKTKAEVQSLHTVNKELLDGQEKINEILSGMRGKLREIDEHAEALDEKEAELRAALQHLSEVEAEDASRGGLDVDQAVMVEGGALHRQMVDSYSMDAAVDDAIYFLGEALSRGVIECDVYLRRVRNLARKQFLLRAVMDKCRQRQQQLQHRQRMGKMERSDSSKSTGADTAVAD